MQRSLRSKSTPIPYGKYFYSYYWSIILWSPWEYIHPKGWNSHGGSLVHIFSNLYIAAEETTVLYTLQ